ncbi:hypothetical protein EDB83DRAFT_2321322 [Lactarius deliciosus]|nr:hypothetical protein EDB83DRAFT_2321322 [Lactarius deliciosus]
MSSHDGKKARPRISSKEQYHSSLRIVVCSREPAADAEWNDGRGQIHAPEMNLQNITGTRQREPHLLQRVAEKNVGWGVAIPFLRVLQSMEVPGALPARGVPRLHKDITARAELWNLATSQKPIRAQTLEHVTNARAMRGDETGERTPDWLQKSLIVALVAFTKIQKIVDTGSNPIVKLKLKPITNSVEYALIIVFGVVSKNNGSGKTKSLRVSIQAWWQHKMRTAAFKICSCCCFWRCRTVLSLVLSHTDFDVDMVVMPVLSWFLEVDIGMFGATYFTGHSPKSSEKNSSFPPHHLAFFCMASQLLTTFDKSPFLRLFHLRDTRFVYSTLLFENPYRTTITVPIYQLEMIIANRHHAIGDVVGGTTPEAERVQTWAAKIDNGNPDMPMADENAFPRLPAASSVQWNECLSHIDGANDVIERWEDKMGYGVFRDVFQVRSLEWQATPTMQARNQFTGKHDPGHLWLATVYQIALFFTWVVEMAGEVNLDSIRDRSEAIISQDVTRMTQRHNYKPTGSKTTCSSTAYITRLICERGGWSAGAAVWGSRYEDYIVIVGPGEWVKGWGRSGADFCYVHLCATGALKTPGLSFISYSRFPNLSFRMFLYRSSELPGVGDGLIGFDRVNARPLWRRAGIRNTNIPAAAKSSSPVNLELSENTVVPAADLPFEGTLTTSA